MAAMFIVLSALQFGDWLDGGVSLTHAQGLLTGAGFASLVPAMWLTPLRTVGLLETPAPPACARPIPGWARVLYAAGLILLGASILLRWLH